MLSRIHGQVGKVTAYKSVGRGRTECTVCVLSCLHKRGCLVPIKKKKAQNNDVILFLFHVSYFSLGFVTHIHVQFHRILPLPKCSKGMLTMKDTEIWPSSFHRLALLWFCPWSPKCFFQSNKHDKCTKLKLRIHNFIANIDCKATRRVSHRRDPGREVESEKSGLPNRPSWPATVEDSKPRRHLGSIAVRRQTKGHWKMFVIKSETDIFQRCWGFIWNQIFSEAAAWFSICYDSHNAPLPPQFSIVPNSLFWINTHARPVCCFVLPPTLVSFGL